MTLHRLDSKHTPTHRAEFYDELVRRSQKHGGSSKLMYRMPAQLRRFEQVLGFAKFVREQGARTCLELGCAEGRMTAWLASLFSQVDGVDISPVAVRLCPELDNVRYWIMDCEEELPPGAWDVIVASELLEHLCYPKEALGSFAERCRWLIVSCPLNEVLNPRTFAASLVGQETRQADATGHIWAMDEEGFQELVGSLEVVQMEIQPRRCAVALLRGELCE